MEVRLCFYSLTTIPSPGLALGEKIGWFALFMEAGSTPKALVNFYRTTRSYNPEDRHLGDEEDSSTKKGTRTVNPGVNVLTGLSWVNKLYDCNKIMHCVCLIIITFLEKLCLTKMNCVPKAYKAFKWPRDGSLITAGYDITDKARYCQ